jgi:hypothetical protein
MVGVASRKRQLPIHRGSRGRFSPTVRRIRVPATPRRQGGLPHSSSTSPSPPRGAAGSRLRSWAFDGWELQTSFRVGFCREGVNPVEEAGTVGRIGCLSVHVRARKGRGADSRDAVGVCRCVAISPQEPRADPPPGILEGSVPRAQGRVRISTRLTDAATRAAAPDRAQRPGPEGHLHDPERRAGDRAAPRRHDRRG